MFRAVLMAGLMWAGAAGADTLAFTFAGNADTVTRPFHIEAPWELQWSSKAEYMIVGLFRADGTAIGSYSGGPPGGSAFQPKGGDFYLEAAASGAPWTVKVVAISK